MPEAKHAYTFRFPIYFTHKHALTRTNLISIVDADLLLGFRVGYTVGINDGKVVGLADGEADGPGVVGFLVGESVGVAEGSGVGLQEEEKEEGWVRHRGDSISNNGVGEVVG